MKRNLLSSEKFLNSFPKIKDNYTLIIDFEGLDGTYKNTNAIRLHDYCCNLFEDNEDIDIRVFHFPSYNDDTAFFVKKYLNGDFDTNISDPSDVDFNTIKNDIAKVTTFFSIDMYGVMAKEAKNNKLFYKPTIVIFDRYFYSMFYYLTKLFVAMNPNEYVLNRIINTICYYIPTSVFGLPTADCVVSLKNSNFVYSYKERDKNTSLDIYESDDGYLYNVSKIFLDKINFNPYVTNKYSYLNKTPMIDATHKTQDEVFKDVLDSVTPFIDKFKNDVSMIKEEDKYWKEK